jgi:hypothetical protein
LIVQETAQWSASYNYWEAEALNKVSNTNFLMDVQVHLPNDEDWGTLALIMLSLTLPGIA